MSERVTRRTVEAAFERACKALGWTTPASGNPGAVILDYKPGGNRCYRLMIEEEYSGEACLYPHHLDRLTGREMIAVLDAMAELKDMQRERTRALAEK